jgi:hypothetical protein
LYGEKEKDYIGLIKYLQLTLNLIQSLGLKKLFPKDTENELNWFYSISFNLGLESSNQKIYDLASQFMRFSYLFLIFQNNPQENS